MLRYSAILPALMLLTLGCTSSDDTNSSSNNNDAGVPAAPTYRFEPLEVPGAATQSVPLVMSEGGLVGGWYDDANGKFHGFIHRDGEFTTIDAPDAADTFVVSVFDDGRFQGTLRDASGAVHGYLFANDTWTLLDVPEAGVTTDIPFEVGTGLGTAAFVMNTAGVVVGEYATDDGIGHGWIHDGSVYTTIDHPDASGSEGPNTMLFAAADDGRVVGRVTRTGAPLHKGFLLENGELTDIMHPDQGGFFGTQSNGITESGIITGVYSDADSKLHGFILENGAWTTVDYPGAAHSEIHYMDSAGNFTGGWFDEDFHLHGFVAFRE